MYGKDTRSRDTRRRSRACAFFFDVCRFVFHIELNVEEQLICHWGHFFRSYFVRVIVFDMNSWNNAPNTHKSTYILCAIHWWHQPESHTQPISSDKSIKKRSVQTITRWNTKKNRFFLFFTTGPNIFILSSSLGPHERRKARERVQRQQ